MENDNMRIEELKADFISSSIKIAELQDADEVDKSNAESARFHSEIKPSVRGLSDRGEVLLKELIEHKDENVQVNAASLLLAIDESAALSTLKKLENSSSVGVTMSAIYLPKEWKAGNLNEYLG